jgi:hypothetical protein
LFSTVFGDIEALKEQYNSIFVRKAYESLTNEIQCNDEKDCFSHGTCQLVNN